MPGQLVFNTNRSLCGANGELAITIPNKTQTGKGNYLIHLLLILIENIRLQMQED